ncbi:hypothetical protein BROUX41_004989 [Berkeleyomyces rouxiae]|uniref:uncharacterized protein n=1 Tax=Berkeleyomyces rouxiae TaxID=2035830 RepID=UPI003B770FA5
MEDNSQILSLPHSTPTEVQAQGGDLTAQQSVMSTTNTTAPAIAVTMPAASANPMHHLPSISALATTTSMPQNSQPAQVRTTIPPSQPMFTGASPAATAGGSGNTLASAQSARLSHNLITFAFTYTHPKRGPIKSHASTPRDLRAQAHELKAILLPAPLV